MVYLVWCDEKEVIRVSRNDGRLDKLTNGWATSITQAIKHLLENGVKTEHIEVAVDNCGTVNGSKFIQ